MHAYEQSAKHGIRDKSALFNLGVLYSNYYRLNDAIMMLQRAAAIDSSDTLITSNLGLMVAKRASDGSPQK
jgi:Flp pilus assembly protein TadD